MKLTREHPIACSAERFWQLAFDPAFDGPHSLQALSAADYQVIERSTEGPSWILRSRVTPSVVLPAFIKKWIGDRMTYEMTVTREAGSDEAHAEFKMSVMTDRIRMGYHMRVTPQGPDSCLRAMEWEVKISGFGGIFEQFVMGELKKGVEASAHFYNTWVGSGGNASVRTAAQAQDLLAEKLFNPSAEINLTEHCNLRCAGCNHASPHLAEKFADLETYRQDLASLSGALHLGELKFVGGEPLLHPQLVEFLKMARDSGIADQYTLVTNGVLLHKMPREVWELIDRLWISIYPGVKLRFDMAEIERLCARHEVELWQKEQPAFQLTMLNQPLVRPDLVEHVFRSCAYAHDWYCHTIHEGRYYKCSPAPFMHARQQLLGVETAGPAADSVAIRDNPELRAELQAYLRSDRPLSACTYCAGSLGREMPSRQLRKPDLEAELREDHTDTAALFRTDLIPPQLRINRA